jgi:4-cresol dehydrogenase (hydroxylating)
MSTQVTAEVLEHAVAELQAAVGQEHVLVTEAEREAHAKDTSLWHRLPCAVVYPGTVEEVTEIVKVAGRFRLAVWPSSKGKNWGYGAHMALHEGALVVLLDRMNHILETNEELGYAVIEPGVTQGQLNAHLEASGIRLWVDCTDSTPEGSVIGNALERGVGYTPYWDHFASLCGLEVVLPSGDVVRTGGGPPNSLTWNTYKWGTGPYLEGLFSQSNLGIVTKAGVWLMPEPETVRCFICEIEDEAKQPAATDALRLLALHGVLRSNVHMVNDVMFLAQMAQYPYDLLDGRTNLPADVRARLRSRYRIAPWTVTGGLYGTARQVRAAQREVRKALSPYGRVRFLGDTGITILRGLTGAWKLLERIPAVTRLLSRATGSSLEKLELIPHVYSILKGVPGEHIVGFAYFKSRRERPRANLDPGRDGAGITWMAVVSPLTGRHTAELVRLCESAFERHGLDFSITFITVNPRSAVGLIELFYDRDDPDERTRMLALYDELAERTLAAGYPQYRTSVWLGEHVLGASPELQRFVDSLKGAVDPNHILAPGRYSIGVPPS